MATDPGNTFSSARDLGILGRSKVISGSVSNADKLDFFRFRIANRSSFSSLLRVLSGNADLALYDRDFQRIGISGKSGKQPETISQVLEAGSYFVRVNRRSGTPGYRLKLTTGTPPDLAGNDRTTARSINIGATSTTFTDAVSTTDSNDFYQFTTTAFGNLNLNLTGLSADANVQIQNSTGTVIRSSVAGDNTSESLNLGLAAGTYFVRVFPGTSSATTDYDLSLSLSPLKIVGLANNNSLVSFNLGDSAAATSTAVTGLVSGETLLGIDFRPATGQLFGLGSTSRLYTIDLATGAATQLNTTPFSTPLSGSNFGFDFNPAVDRIRVVSDTEQNLRLNPDTGALVLADTPLNPAGDVVASAYTNNRAGTTTTTLFGIDSTSDSLVRQGGVDGNPSPNGGLIASIGALGVDFAPTAGFDIFTDGIGANYAYATSGSTLYSINLATGATTGAGAISVNGVPVNLVGLAIRG